MGFFSTTGEVFCKRKIRKTSPVVVNLDPQKTPPVSSTGEVFCVILTTRYWKNLLYLLVPTQVKVNTVNIVIKCFSTRPSADTITY